MAATSGLVSSTPSTCGAMVVVVGRSMVMAEMPMATVVVVVGASVVDVVVVGARLVDVVLVLVVELEVVVEFEAVAAMAVGCVGGVVASTKAPPAKAPLVRDETPLRARSRAPFGRAFPFSSRKGDGAAAEGLPMSDPVPKNKAPTVMRHAPVS